LDRITREAQREHPGVGIRMLKEYPRSKEYSGKECVSHFSGLTLQVYIKDGERPFAAVSTGFPGSLALWHIGGNQKLIR